MKRLHFLTFLAFALFPGLKSTAATLDIVVDGRGWGTASAKEVHAIALAAGAEIARHCPRTRIGPIVVHHRDDHPQTAWERTPEGKIIVGIAARDRQCAQIAFQFAHEFCHVLAMWANAERGTRSAERWNATSGRVGVGGAAARQADGPNLWLEESFAEAASLFALRAMAESWQRSAPFRNWRTYAPRFADYAAERMRAPAAGGRGNFARWFRQNEPAMRRNPNLRASNSIVAMELLPLLEAEPRGWEAITFLNLGTRDRKLPLAAFLAEWRQNCPPPMRPFVSKVAQVFGVRL